MQSSDQIDAVRASIINSDRQFQVIEGGKGDDAGPPPEEKEGDQPCPVTPLGHLNGIYIFLDSVGQLRELSARQVGARHDLMALFMGNDRWLKATFPKKVTVKVKGEDGEEKSEERTVDFKINSAAAWLQAQCGHEGLYGDHIKIRKPGIWPAENGMPVVHCGNKVLIGDKLVNAGTRTGNQIWAAAAPSPRPGHMCGPEIGERLVQQIRTLWNFRAVGGEIAAVGLLACAYYGASIPWRPAGFLVGGTGCGKSSLLNVMRAASPLHVHTNDTSKAGLEQRLDGRAMPAFIDEAADRADQQGARALVDTVLSSSGGEGTKGVRGGKDGVARSIEVVASIIMASIAPPPMEAQHMNRFTIIDLMKPEDGVDYGGAHEQLLRWAEKHGPSLWGRALAGWERYRAALVVFRVALSAAGCRPRDMDQLGAIMAGWWVLTRDGVPDERGGKEGVGALIEYVRDEVETVAQDGPTRMMNHLMSQLVMVQRSTERKSISALIDRVLSTKPDIENDAEVGISQGVAREVLGQHGIRVILPVEFEQKAKSGATPPREADGAGLWFSQSNAMLKRLFEGTSWAGDRWLYDLRRLESARCPKRNVKIGSMPPARCVWITAVEVGFGVDENA